MNISRPIVQEYLPQSFWKGAQIVQLQVLHDTGNYLGGDGATGNFNFWLKRNNGCAAHGIIDKTKILECIPWNQKAWHVGGAGNYRSWGNELCNMTNQEDFNSQIDDVARYYALFRFNHMGGIDVTKDNLKSHQECNQTMSTGSDHTDVSAYFAHFGYTMDMFRALVQSYLNQLKQRPDATSVEELTSRMKARKLIGDELYWQSAIRGEVEVHSQYLLIVFNRACGLPEGNMDKKKAIDAATQKYGLNSPGVWMNVLNEDEEVNLSNMVALFNKMTK